jgi:hypothetical protein
MEGYKPLSDCIIFTPVIYGVVYIALTPVMYRGVYASLIPVVYGVVYITIIAAGIEGAI